MKQWRRIFTFLPFAHNSKEMQFSRWINVSSCLKANKYVVIVVSIASFILRRESSTGENEKEAQRKIEGDVEQESEIMLQPIFTMPDYSCECTLEWKPDRRCRFDGFLLARSSFFLQDDYERREEVDATGQTGQSDDSTTRQPRLLLLATAICTSLAHHPEVVRLLVLLILLHHQPR